MFGSIFDRSARKEQVEVTPACSTNMRASSFVVLDLKVGGRRPSFQAEISLSPKALLCCPF
jgi:hypothetical protein